MSIKKEIKTNRLGGLFLDILLKKKRQVLVFSKLKKEINSFKSKICKTMVRDAIVDCLVENKAKDIKKKKFLKIKRRLKTKLNLRRFIYYKIHVILLIKDLQKYQKIRKIRKILKNKVRKKRPQAIIKHLNFKFRVKKRKKESLNINRFIKRNKKWEKTRKPHFLVLRTSESNSHMSLTDSKGNTKFVCSCGQLGFRGAKRSSKYAIEKLALHVVNKLRKYRLLNILLKIKGYSTQHRIVFKVFIKVKKRFKGITGISVAHNGCRLKKIRRK